MSGVIKDGQPFGGIAGANFACIMGSNVRFFRNCPRLNWESSFGLVSVMARGVDEGQSME